MSLSNLLIKAEAALNHKEIAILNTATQIITAADTEIEKLAQGENKVLPEIEAVENSSVWAAVAAYIPVAGTIQADIVKILNRYQPFITAAANDPVILTNIGRSAIAEVAKTLGDVETTIDQWLEKLIKFLKSVNM